MHSAGQPTALISPTSGTTARGRRPAGRGAAPHQGAAAAAEDVDPLPWARLIPFAVGFSLAVFLCGFACYNLLNPGAPARGDADVPALGEDAGPLARAVAFALAAVTILGGGRWCAFFAFAFLAYCRNRRLRRTLVPPARWPGVSILVPAYNEGDTIAPALQSLLELDYPEYEVVVVDDGSTDQTYARAKPFQGTHVLPASNGQPGGLRRCEVRVYAKPNGGKSSAHNFAFHRCRHELVLCVDADSRLDPGSLRRMVLRMTDPRVAAVAGQVRVRNRVNAVTRLQALEYIIGNGLVRMAQSLTGTVLVVPGPIGLFRRSVLEEVYLRYGSARAADGDDVARAGEVAGPFELDTFAEDFDLSLTVLGLGGRIVYEPDAVSHTKAPDATVRLLNQRYRWGRGSIQVLRKYFRRSRQSPGMRRPAVLGWILATYALDVLVLPVVFYLSLCLLLAYLAAGGSAPPLLAWVLAVSLLNLNAAAFFTAVHRDTPAALAVLPLYDLYHGFVLNGGWLISVIDELRGARMKW